LADAANDDSRWTFHLDGLREAGAAKRVVAAQRTTNHNESTVLNCSIYVVTL